MNKFFTIAQVVAMLQMPPMLVERAIKELRIEQGEVNFVRGIWAEDMNRLAAHVWPPRSELQNRADSLQ